jgi:hypothetical protein
MTSAQHAQHVYVTKFIRTFFIRGQSLYGTMFIRDKVHTGTKFIQGQSLYEDKVYTEQRKKWWISIYGWRYMRGGGYNLG